MGNAQNNFRQMEFEGYGSCSNFQKTIIRYFQSRIRSCFEIDENY